ncbi:hypothetical protein R6Q59_010123 [Mikania micrantha]
MPPDLGRIDFTPREPGFKVNLDRSATEDALSYRQFELEIRESYFRWSTVRGYCLLSMTYCHEKQRCQSGSQDQEYSRKALEMEVPNLAYWRGPLSEMYLFNITSQTEPQHTQTGSTLSSFNLQACRRDGVEAGIRTSYLITFWAHYTLTLGCIEVASAGRLH